MPTAYSDDVILAGSQIRNCHYANIRRPSRYGISSSALAKSRLALAEHG